MENKYPEFFEPAQCHISNKARALSCLTRAFESNWSSVSVCLDHYNKLPVYGVHHYVVSTAYPCIQVSCMHCTSPFEKKGKNGSLSPFSLVLRPAAPSCPSLPRPPIDRTTADPADTGAGESRLDDESMLLEKVDAISTCLAASQPV